MRTDCEIIINTTSEISKATRGTKRVCQACEIRFYDLSRESIVCPACGASYTVVARPVINAGTHVASAGKTAWRSKGFRRPKPVLPVDDPEQTAPEPAQDAAEEEAPSTVPEDDLVLEQEPDEGDVTDLVGRDNVEPKER